MGRISRQKIDNVSNRSNRSKEKLKQIQINFKKSNKFHKNKSGRNNSTYPSEIMQQIKNYVSKSKTFKRGKSTYDDIVCREKRENEGKFFESIKNYSKSQNNADGIICLTLDGPNLRTSENIIQHFPTFSAIFVPEYFKNVHENQKKNKKNGDKLNFYLGSLQNFILDNSKLIIPYIQAYNLDYTGTLFGNKTEGHHPLFDYKLILGQTQLDMLFFKINFAQRDRNLSEPVPIFDNTNEKNWYHIKLFTKESGFMIKHFLKPIRYKKYGKSGMLCYIFVVERVNIQGKINKVKLPSYKNHPNGLPDNAKEICANHGVSFNFILSDY